MIKISLKNLKKLIREEIINEDLWAHTLGYKEDEYDDKGHHKEDKLDVNDDLPEDNMHIYKNK